jgi:hypothetical protein
MTQSPLASPEPWDLVADGYLAENVPVFERFAQDALELAPSAPAGWPSCAACSRRAGAPW